MSNVRDIRSHPKFQGKLDEDDPNFERDQYLRYLDGGDLDPGSPSLGQEDPLEDLEENPVEPKRTIHVGLSVCRDCEFKQDRRPWWKRFFLPDSARAIDLSCRAFPRKQVNNPITGKSGFLPEGPQIPAYAQDEEAFPRCIIVNLLGTCRLFKPRITYR